MNAKLYVWQQLAGVEVGLCSLVGTLPPPESLPVPRVSGHLPLDPMISNQGGKREGRPTRKMTLRPISLWKEKNSLSHLLCSPQLGLVTYPACGTPKVFLCVTHNLWQPTHTTDTAPNPGKKPVTFSNFIMLAVSSRQRTSTFNCTCDPRLDGAVCL